ncbi:VOC family protein [Clostridium sp.]|uniref:VOC family protein n=1 Tax=Clostridium sp. TaxID=1506 RepID=UPI003F313A7A
MKLHHIGIITYDIDKDVHLYINMGYRANEMIVDEIQNNQIIFLYKNNEPTIELIQAINNDSTVKNTQLGYHHLCYKCNKEDIIDFVKNNKGKLFIKSLIAPALDNANICFAYFKSGIIIEFIIEEENE